MAQSFITVHFANWPLETKLLANEFAASKNELNAKVHSINTSTVELRFH